MLRQDIAELLAPRNLIGWRLNPPEWHRYQDAMRDAMFCLAPSGCDGLADCTEPCLVLDQAWPHQVMGPTCISRGSSFGRSSSKRSVAASPLICNGHLLNPCATN